MRNRRPLRTLGVVAVSGLIGYLIGPPIVQAAANLVVIKDADSSAKAQVANGRLKVDTELPPATGGVLDVNTEATLDGFTRLRVNVGRPHSADDPADAFSFIATHEFTFSNDPAGGLQSQTDTTTHPNPCTINTPTVVTGVDLSQSSPAIGGVGQLFHLQMFDVAETPDELMFDQFHPQGFHDDTGIVWSGASVPELIQIKTFMVGAAGTCTGEACVPPPETFSVPVVVQGYCSYYPKGAGD
jgi:hypothetical protein